MKNLDKLKYSISAIICAAMLCATLAGCDSTPSGGQSGADSSNGGSVITDANGNTLDTSPVTLPETPQVTDAVAGETVTADTDGSITLADSGITVTGTGLTADGSTVTISAAGTYTVSGKLSDGQIIVNTEDTEKVKLIFNGVDIHCDNSAAVYVVNAPKKVIIYTQKGSVNLVSDGETRTDGDDVPTAAIYSHDDLKLDGEGELYVTGSYGKGIMSKDDIEICGGTIYVTAVDDGIRGKDSVEMTGGYVVIDAGADGLRSSNDSEAAKGYITVSDGELYIKAAQDGIQAETTLTVSGGKISVVSDGGSANASTDKGGGPGGDFPGGGSFPEGNFPGGDGNFPGGDGNGGGRPGGNGGNGGNGGGRPGNNGSNMSSEGSVADISDLVAIGFATAGSGTSTSALASTSTSASTADDASTKGLKAGVAVIISGGEITVDSADDAVHSNDSATISGGMLTLSTGGDGIHADATLTVSGGSITVTGSYEGLEALTLNIEGGVINVTASDDGMNAAGGTTSSGRGRPGGGNASDSSGLINITGGTVTVNAGGDGIDSNGNIRMSGGTVIVYGPTDNGNGALDFDGSFTMSGGTLLAVGSSGMVQKPTGSGSVRVLSANVSINAGSTVSITDASGDVVTSFTAPKRIASFIYAAEGLDGSYSIVVDLSQAATVKAS